MTARDLRKNIITVLIPKIKNSKIFIDNIELDKEIVDRFINNLIDSSFLLLEYISKANSIYPTIPSEVEKRRLLQDDAIACCGHLYELLEFLIDLKCIKISSLESYVNDIHYLIKLLRGWKQSNNKILKSINKNI